MLKKMENYGTKEIGLVTPTPVTLWVGEIRWNVIHVTPLYASEHGRERNQTHGLFKDLSWERIITKLSTPYMAVTPHMRNHVFRFLQRWMNIELF